MHPPAPKASECACLLAFLLAHVFRNPGVNQDADFTRKQAKLGGKPPIFSANSILTNTNAQGTNQDIETQGFL